MSLTQSLEGNSEVRVVGTDWPLFRAWLKETWTPGLHFALVGPTGEGKTTFACGILTLRNWVMALDPKGEDDTLTASGFIRVTEFPLPRKIRNDIADGKPARLIIGGSARNDAEEAHLRELMRKAVAMARQQGGWTLYVDEFQVLADLRMFNLGKPVEQLLITARKNRTSVVTSYQAPAWVPRAATRQAWGVAIFPTRDRGMIKSVAESMGRPWHELEKIIDMLPQFHAIVIPRSIHAPMVLVHPPKIG